MGLRDDVDGIGADIAVTGKDVGPTVSGIAGALADFGDAGKLGLAPDAGTGTAGADAAVPTANSPILMAGQRVIAGMRATTGTDGPEAGDRFGAGATGFLRAGSVLTTAAPTDDWTGAAADAYTTQNTTQVDRTHAIASLDGAVHAVVRREAGQLAAGREVLDEWSNWLAEVGLYTAGLSLVPGIGPALRAAAEMQAVGAAVGVASAELSRLSADVESNAATITALADGYEQISRSAALGGGPVLAPPPDVSDDVDDDIPEDNCGDDCDDAGEPAAGGGVPSSGGAAATSTQTPLAAATPVAAAAPRTAPVPAAPVAGALPTGSAGAPTAGGGTASLTELIAAAVQRAMEHQRAEEERLREEAENAGDPEEDAAEHGDAPVHVQVDVDPDRLSTPVTITLDRDRAIVTPPTTARG